FECLILSSVFILPFWTTDGQHPQPVQSIAVHDFNLFFYNYFGQVSPNPKLFLYIFILFLYFLFL
ncbi:MAG TPA: hypothetical protein VK982_10215, partial [Bacteroidales bacterium]|nr:hypothetical protein [Bacteroidales bacterium]